MGKVIWGKFSSLLGIRTGKECTDNTKRHNEEFHIVTAALMIHVSITHEDFSKAEKTRVLACIQEHFGLEEVVAHQIFEKATDHHDKAIDLYEFTRVIMRELEQEGQQEIVRLLYRVAFADHHLDHFEENVISKISGLLGVGVRDRVRIKQEVRAELEA